MSGVESHPNIVEAGRDDFEGPGEVVDPAKEDIEKRIHLILSVYPKVSPSMLQVALGTSLPPAVWRPVLEKMITQGTVVRGSVAATTPHGRYQTYRTLELKGKPQANPSQPNQ